MGISKIRKGENMKKNQFLSRLKFVKLSDIIAIFKMLAAIPISLIFKLKHNNIWLVCERKNEARDNGYWFFKYICEYHPEIESIYAIDKNSQDYLKIKDLGKIIQFGSFEHWIYYFSANRNISSQKEGKPNAAICFFLEVYINSIKNRAYIRHGICKDDQRWVYYDVTKMNLFACSSKREFDFVTKKFGYPKGYVQLLGLCRFDNLLSKHEIKRQILVMPTMREWIKTISKDTEIYEGSRNVEESEFFKTWNSFLNNIVIHEYLEKNNIELVFYPHSSLQKYLSLFSTTCSRIIIASFKEYDVQQLLMESIMLVTDYSSVYFDFAYMKKPIIYYQFDYEKYRKGQYQEGYFSYEEDGFGPIVLNEKQLILEIEMNIEEGISMPDKYCKRVDSFFAFHDTNNCMRTFNAIKNMRK